MWGGGVILQKFKQQMKKIFILLLLSILFSCVQDDLTNKTINDELENGSNEIFPIEFKINNPYDVNIMRAAMDTIRYKVKKGIYNLILPENNTDSTLINFQINPSHTYIQYTPNSEEELAILKRDSTLVLSDYPLDYDLPDSYFVDRPEPSPGSLPVYYTAVKVGSNYNQSISHETLGDLYISEEDDFFNLPPDAPVTKETYITNEEDLLHHLLYEAYRLVGREQELLDDNGSNTDPNGGTRFWIFGRKWYPSGTLHFWDQQAGQSSGGQYCYWQTVIDYSGCWDNDGTFLDCPEYHQVWTCDPLPNIQGKMVPLKGAQVLMRQLFTVRQAITNNEGNFQTNFVRGKARYVIQWERYQYSIRNGTIFQAELRGPYVKDQPWIKNIQGGDDEYHAMIHTGAHNYYYGGRYGTMTPPRNCFGGCLQMKIAALEVNGSSSHIPFASEISGNLFPTIFIKAWQEESDIVYGTTIHELAHAAHRNLDPVSHDNVVWDAYTNVCITPPIGNCQEPMGPTAHNNRRLMETWATTIETLFTLARYRNGFGQTNYTYRLNNFQDRIIASSAHYTSAGIDMIEGNYGIIQFNQGFNNNILPEDRTNNYTIGQLEWALFSANSWWAWRDRIYNLYPNNNTKIYLDELFNNWP